MRSGGSQTNLFTQTGLYLRSYAPTILSEFLQDDANLVDIVLTHGCFCAKLDNTNPNLDFLGGTTTIDELDEICKSWLRARNCNDNLVGGSCQANRQSMRTGAYTMSIASNLIENSVCGFTTADCEEDTCKIDITHLKEIRRFFDDNPGYGVMVWNLTSRPRFRGVRKSSNHDTMP